MIHACTGCCHDFIVKVEDYIGGVMTESVPESMNWWGAMAAAAAAAGMALQVIFDLSSFRNHHDVLCGLMWP